MRPLVVPHSVTLPALLLCVAALLPALPAVAQQPAAQPPPRMAVLELERVGVSEAEGAAITDRLRTELAYRRRFTVLERVQTERALAQAGFLSPDPADAEQVVRIGKQLDAAFVVTGRVTQLTGTYQVNVQMTQVKTGAVVHGEAVLHAGDIIGSFDTMRTLTATLTDAVERAPRAGVPATPEPTPPPPPIATTDLAPAIPPPEPVVERNPTRWGLLTGGALVAVAALLEVRALARGADAAATAETARSEENTALYEDAKTQREDAESLERTAVAVGLIGAILLVRWALSGDGSDSADAGPPAVRPPVQLALAPQGGLRVGYALHW
jgi:TolB-like protein